MLRAAEVTETSAYENPSPHLPWQISKKMLFAFLSIYSIICRQNSNNSLCLSSARSDSVRGEEAVYSPGASKTHRPSEGAYCGFTFWCTSPAVDPHITSENTS